MRGGFGVVGNSGDPRARVVAKSDKCRRRGRDPIDSW
jgi:hypothetical protein